MKVSEAIRKGAEQVPGRCTGQFFDYDEDDNLIAVCALGAAYIGAGGEVRRKLYNAWEATEALLPELRNQVFIKDQPQQRLDHGHYRRTLEELIYQLNDTDGWTLPKIADYVEGLGY